MLGFSAVSETPLATLPSAGAVAAGFRSFAMFWVGGVSGTTFVSTGQPIIKRTATIPFLGGSLRQGRF
jgi:hypothetical protein